jgi:hypothetical protein
MSSLLCAVLRLFRS